MTDYQNKKEQNKYPISYLDFKDFKSDKEIHMIFHDGTGDSTLDYMAANRGKKLVITNGIAGSSSESELQYKNNNFNAQLSKHLYLLGVKRLASLKLKRSELPALKKEIKKTVSISERIYEYINFENFEDYDSGRVLASSDDIQKTFKKEFKNDMVDIIANGLLSYIDDPKKNNYAYDENRAERTKPNTLEHHIEIAAEKYGYEMDESSVGNDPNISMAISRQLTGTTGKHLGILAADDIRSSLLGVDDLFNYVNKNVSPEDIKGKKSAEFIQTSIALTTTKGMKFALQRPDLIKSMLSHLC